MEKIKPYKIACVFFASDLEPLLLNYCSVSCFSLLLCMDFGDIVRFHADRYGERFDLEIVYRDSWYHVYIVPSLDD